MLWGLGGPEEDHQLHHCCWTGRVSEREEEEYVIKTALLLTPSLSSNLSLTMNFYACMCQSLHAIP